MTLVAATRAHVRVSLAVALAVACSVVAGCAAAPTKTTVVSFVDLDCSDCGDDMARALIQADGVKKTAFDARKAELRVVAEESVDVFALAQAKKPQDEGWRLVPGAGKGTYLPWEKASQGSDVKEVATDGQDVPDLATHLAPGKVTIVDFSAKWCEPCRELDKHVLEMVAKRADVAYRKLDVGDWDTPLAKRYLTGVKLLPHVLVFDGAGKQVAAISGLDTARLDAVVNEAAGGTTASAAEKKP